MINTNPQKKPNDLKEKGRVLCNILTNISNVDDMFDFLKDLLTEGEMLELSQRLDIARRLDQKQSYKQIEKETGASSTTIARAAKYLKGRVEDE